MHNDGALLNLVCGRWTRLRLRVVGFDPEIHDGTHDCFEHVLGLGCAGEDEDPGRLPCTPSTVS